MTGVLGQDRRALGGDRDLVREVCDRCGLTVSEARSLLAKFGLGAEQVTRPAGTLSPGERTRAELAVFQALGVNFLVLDEPTNHLDLPAIEQLESALRSFAGDAAAGHPRPADARVGRTDPDPPAGLTRRGRPPASVGSGRNRTPVRRRGGTVVGGRRRSGSSAKQGRRWPRSTARTARSNASAVAGDGAWTPPTFRTY